MKRGLMNGMAYSKKMDSRVWLAFADMLNCPEKNVEHVSEIYEKAMRGEIDIDNHVNIFGMDYLHSMFHNKKERVEGFKTPHISFDKMDEDSGNAKNSTLISADIASYRQSHTNGYVDDYEKFIETEEYKSSLEMLKVLSEDMRETRGIDLIVTIKRALKGVPSAIKTLKAICEDYEVVASYVKVVLSAGVVE